MAEHDHGSHNAKVHSSEHGPSDSVIDVEQHQQTFAAFIRFWVWLAGGSIAVLIFLALFNS